jgi:hypothetical protein
LGVAFVDCFIRLVLHDRGFRSSIDRLIGSPQGKHLAKHGQRGYGRLRWAQRHPGAGCGIKHPRRQFPGQAIQNLDMDDLLTPSADPPVHRNLLAAERVPWVLNHYKR